MKCEVLLDRGLSWIIRHRRALFVALLLIKSELALLRIWGYFQFQNGRWYNFVSYWDFASAATQGYLPYIHYWVEYPPVFPWLATFLFLLSTFAGYWSQPIFYVLILLTLVAADSGCLFLVYRTAQIAYRDERLATLAGLVQVLFFVPVYLYTGWFDTLPTLFLLVAVFQLLRSRALQVGIWTGIGALTKFFPGVVLLVAWLHLQSSQRLRLLVGLTVTVVGIMLPLVIMGPEMTAASIRGYVSRPSWETIWALLDGYYGSGGHPLPESRFDPQAVSWVQHVSRLPTWVPLTFLVLVIGLILLRVSHLYSASQVIALTGLLVNVLLLTSKGYSPQYLTWVIPFIALLAVKRPIWLLIGAGLVLSNLVEYPLYFHFFPQEPVVLAFAVTVRSGLLLFSSILQWQMLGKRATVSPFIHT